jgi:hypothetical protein
MTGVLLLAQAALPSVLSKATIRFWNTDNINTEEKRILFHPN